MAVGGFQNLEQMNKKALGKSSRKHERSEDKLMTIGRVLPARLWPAAAKIETVVQSDRIRRASRWTPTDNVSSYYDFRLCSRSPTELSVKLEVPLILIKLWCDLLHSL